MPNLSGRPRTPDPGSGRHGPEHLVRGLVALGAAVVLAGSACTARSGATSPTPRATPPTPAPTPPPEPEPPPPPREVEPPPADVCIPTRDGSCLPGPEFHAQAEALATDHLADPAFGAQWGLESINAHRAYAHVDLLEGEGVAPGEGVTLGFIDTGIDHDHPSLAGKWIHEVLLPGAEDETGEDYSHGTMVAGVAAGVPTGNSGFSHGVAWGADIAMWAIPLGSGDGIYDPLPVDILGLVDGEDADQFQAVFDWRDGERRVDILNLSFGYQGIIETYSEEDLRTYYSQTLEVLAQEGVADPVLLVWAAGNSNGDRCGFGTEGCEDGRFQATSVSLLPGLMTRIEELQPHSVAVVALGPDGGAIAEFSNRCGVAAAFCIAAPGEEIRVAYFGPDEEDVVVRGAVDANGTSFAAPMVSGGLAVMKQLFRDQLSNVELLDRLFRTADDTGIYADREIYGRGRMDLGAATSPVGVLDVPIGAHGAMVAASLDSTQLRMGSAFGSGIGEALAGRELMALDDFGAPFWYSLGSFAVSTDGPSLARRLRTFLRPSPGEDGAGGWTLASATGSSRIEGAARGPGFGGATGHLSLAEGALLLPAGSGDGFTAAAFTTGLSRPQHPAAGGSLRWAPGRLPVGLSAGWIREPESLLGSVGQGAFGQLAASTAFGGLDGGVTVGRWSLGARGEVGVVRPEAWGGVLQDLSLLTTSTFELHADAAFGDGGGLRFSLSQPLRVDRGRASLLVPSERTRDGAIRHQAIAADLAPNGRQLDAAAAWRRPLGLGELRIGAVWTRWPGHQDLPGHGLTLLSGWRWTF